MRVQGRASFLFRCLPMRRFVDDKRTNSGHNNETGWTRWQMIQRKKRMNCKRHEVVQYVRTSWLGTFTGKSETEEIRELLKTRRMIQTFCRNETSLWTTWDYFSHGRSVYDLSISSCLLYILKIKYKKNDVFFIYLFIVMFLFKASLSKHSSQQRAHKSFRAHSSFA